MIRRRAILGSLFVLACTLARAVAPVVQVECALRVRSLSMEGARVYLVSKEGEHVLVSDGVNHFTLPLALQRTYLFSFERPGCISKQLLFDTAVPESRSKDGGFKFALQVAIEPATQGSPLEYAGPVGCIHFDERINGFAYRTDYRIAKDEALDTQLEAFRKEELKRKVAAQPQGIGAVRQANEVVLPAQPVTGTSYERVAPMVARVAPMVHVLEEPGKAGDTSNWQAAHEAKPQPPVMRHKSQTMHTPVHSPAIATPRASSVESGLHVEKLRVVTNTTVVEDNKPGNYQRVASYYGGVTYFRDGYPCSEQIYRQGTGR